MLAGGANTALGLLLFPLLLLTFPFLYKHFVIALMISQCICLTFAFWSYKLFVFQAKGSAIREFAAFAPYYVVNYSLNIAGLPLIVHNLRINPIVAQFLFTIVLIFGSYFWHKYVSFRSRNE